MYQPSNNMPLNSYQVVSPADNQTNFLAGQTIRLSIPRSTGFFDPHTSNLRIQVAVENMNYKMAFSQSCGAASLIDMIRVSVGGQIISETTEYSTLKKLIVDYTESLSIQQRRAVQTGQHDYTLQDSAVNGTGWKPSGANVGPLGVSSGSVLGQPLNGDASTSIAASAKDCKFILTLDGVGLFEMLQVVPCIAIGDILVEIRLVQQNADALKVLPATAIAQNTEGITNTALVCVLDPDGEGFKGFTNISNCPYAIGMEIGCIDAAGDILTPDAAHLITALAQNNDTGKLTITVDTAFNTDEAGGDGRIVILKGTDGNEAVSPNTRFVVKRTDLLLSIVRPPPQYIEGVMNSVNEGMMIDLNSYTTYRATLQKEIKAQTVEIPCFVSRARAVFSIPRKQDDGALTIDNATDRNLNGQYESMKTYRWQVGTVYYPNQPVELAQMESGLHFSAQHIVELEKAMVSANLPVRSLLKTKQNFVVGRALAKHGASVNLTGLGLRWYGEYQTAADPSIPLDVVSFVNHTTRLIINPQGIQVIV
mgnify:CR=1 FL=1|tara:strand:+ start:6261 stop:7868 length:1608 start_codon:yes stop_codon:yes gene_type:complete